MPLKKAQIEFSGFQMRLSSRIDGAVDYWIATIFRVVQLNLNPRSRQVKTTYYLSQEDLEIHIS